MSYIHKDPLFSLRFCIRAGLSEQYDSSHADKYWNCDFLSTYNLKEFWFLLIKNNPLSSVLKNLSGGNMPSSI